MVDAWQRHRFFEGLAQAFLQVGRPLLLVLDNLQWCDQETLAFLAHLLGRAGDSPLLVVGTARDEPGAVDGWFPRMRATGVARSSRSTRSTSPTPPGSPRRSAATP